MARDRAASNSDLDQQRPRGAGEMGKHAKGRPYERRTLGTEPPNPVSSVDDKRNHKERSRHRSGWAVSCLTVSWSRRARESALGTDVEFRETAGAETA